MTYNEYIASPEWLNRRTLYAKSHRPICFICGKKNKHLDLHHLSYENVGHEPDEDLLWLCEDDHVRVHRSLLPLKTAHEVIKKVDVVLKTIPLDPHQYDPIHPPIDLTPKNIIKPKNYKNKWTTKEDFQVINGFRAGMSYEEIALTCERTTAAIIYRLESFGLIEIDKLTKEITILPDPGKQMLENNF